ncbi:hypothetical protein [Defluviimonas sp. SAOS-178_SWC]|uniref:hypothetical protein n=1 Tax=Defluviimonas sp. SAOS-178_SWC TaxID=3121287 RepID=UPI003221ECE6
MKAAGLMIACAALLGCSQPRAHAGVHVTPKGVRVVPSVSTSIAGLGVTVSE